MRRSNQPRRPGRSEPANARPRNRTPTTRSEFAPANPSKHDSNPCRQPTARPRSGEQQRISTWRRKIGSAWTSFAAISSRSALCSTISAGRRRPTCCPSKSRNPWRPAEGSRLRRSASFNSRRRSRRLVPAVVGSRSIATSARSRCAGSRRANTDAKPCSGSGVSGRCANGSLLGRARRSSARTTSTRSRPPLTGSGLASTACTCTRSNAPSAERTAGSARSGTVSE